jgi:hypothetical protein
VSICTVLGSLLLLVPAAAAPPAASMTFEDVTAKQFPGWPSVQEDPVIGPLKRKGAYAELRRLRALGRLRWTRYHGWIFALCFLDADGDGRPDILCTGHEGQGLFLNRGDGTFLPNSLYKSYEPDANGDHGHFYPVTADLDGDGRLDWVHSGGKRGYKEFLVLNRRTKGTRNERFVRLTAGGTRRACIDTQDLMLTDVNGDGFLDLCGRRGVFFGNGKAPNENWVAADVVKDGNVDYMAAVDANRDGLLDLLVVEQQQGQKPRRASLRLSDGKGGFADKTREWGLTDFPVSGLLLAADFDNDGFEDVFAMGQPSPDALTANRAKKGEMVTRLFLNNGGKGFRDVTVAAGFIPSTRITCWQLHYSGATAADLDNDGLIDVVVPDLEAIPGLRVYRNLGGGRFALAAELPIKKVGKSHACVAAADIDGDGRLELAATGGENGVRIFRSTTEGAGANGWLEVVAIGPPGNRTGLGAYVEVFEPGRLGDRRRLVGLRQLQSITRFGSAHWAHFGLGRREAVDVRVTFPGGKTVDAKATKARSKLAVSETGTVKVRK